MAHADDRCGETPDLATEVAACSVREFVDQGDRVVSLDIHALGEPRRAFHFRRNLRAGVAEKVMELLTPEERASLAKRFRELTHTGRGRPAA